MPVDRGGAGRARARGGRRGGQEAGRRRHRPRQRRRNVEAELRHLHQGPARRLRRHRQHLRLPGPRRLPEAGAARVRRSRPLAAQDAGLQRADQRARPAGARATDVDNLKAALARREGGRRLHERRLARRGVAVLPQRPLQGPRDLYLRHRRRDARTNTRPSPRPASCCRSTAPTSAWAGTSNTPTSTSQEFRKRTAAAHRGAQSRAREHPARAAAHASVLGQLRGPAPLRRAARRHHRHRVQGAAARDLARGRQSAPRPRMDAVRDA